MINARWVMYALAVMLLVGTGLLAATRSEEAPQIVDVGTETAGVQPSACPPGTIGRVTCSFVTVPEDYTDPEISTIDIFIAQVRPPLETSGEPVVFVGRGLGVSSVNSFGDWQQLSRDTGREIVLVDLRGSGRSEPAMACPETRTIGWLESDMSPASLNAVRSEFAAALRTCKERLERSIPLDAYGLQSLVLDLDEIRVQLGIERWSVLGAGDAAIVARAYEAQLPDVVDSLLLIGATASDAGRGPSRYAGAREVLDAVLTDDLEAALDDESSPLQTRSFVFTVSVRGRNQRVAVSEETLRPILARAAGDEDRLETIPTLITDRLPQEQLRGLAILRAEQFSGDSRLLAPLLNVVCGDPTMQDAAPLPEAVEDFDTDWTGLLDDQSLHPEFCEIWDPPGHDGVDRAPKSPTLVINGEYDITAPASAAADVEASWPTATALVLPESGRPSLFGPCVLPAIASFLDGVTPTLDQSCR